MTATAAPPGSRRSATAQSPFDSGKVTITPDKATNSLVIMASPTDYQNLVPGDQEARPRQQAGLRTGGDRRGVAQQVEGLGCSAARARASTSKAIRMGAVRLQAVFTACGDSRGKSGTRRPHRQLPDGRVPGNIGAVLKALDSNDLLNVLSTPNILTSDNKEAEIIVGSRTSPFTGRPPSPPPGSPSSPSSARTSASPSRSSPRSARGTISGSTSTRRSRPSVR